MREAILHLGDAQLEEAGIKDLVEAVRTAGFRDATELVCHGPGGVILLQVAESLSEEALDASDAVVWWERLASSASTVTYLCKVSIPEFADDLPLHEHGVAHDVSSVGERGLNFSIIGSHTDIGDTLAIADSSGVDVDIERLTEYRGPDSLLDVLTTRQQQVIETAFAMGYYDVPRTATTEEIAVEIELDPSTVTEHLQRAERNLLSSILGGWDRKAHRVGWQG